MISDERFRFRFDHSYRWLLAALGIWPDKAWAQLTDGMLVIRFGRWVIRTPVDNVAGTTITGPFRAIKAIGVRWSFSDGGLTFGTNTERAICIRFHEPVPGGTPLETFKHPGVTLTLAEPELFGNAIARAQSGRESA